MLLYLALVGMLAVDDPEQERKKTALAARLARRAAPLAVDGKRGNFALADYAKCPNDTWRSIEGWGVGKCVPCPKGKFRDAVLDAHEQRHCHGPPTPVPSPAPTPSLAPTPAPTPRATMSPHALGLHATPAPTPCHRVPGVATLICACAPGSFMYQSMTQQSSPKLCRICPAGKYAQKAATSCTTCTAGRVSKRNAEQCETCYGGQFQPRAGERACAPCSAGQFPVAGATQCAHCPPGKFSAGNEPACAPCTRGRWGVFGAKVAACSGICAAGRYGSGPAKDLMCTGPCKAGRWGRKGAVSIQCNGPCPAGRSGKAGESTTAHCGGACPRGRFSLAEAQFCTSCMAGQYQPISEQTHCRTCVAGKFAPLSADGSIHCRACKLGFESGLGAAKCTPKCHAGQYIALSAKVYGIRKVLCAKCPKGQFSKDGSSMKCQRCNPGKYTNTYRDDCILCEPGMFSAISGATKCSACASGYRPPNAGATHCLDWYVPPTLPSPVPTPAPTPAPPSLAPTPVPTPAPTPVPPTPKPTPTPCDEVTIMDGKRTLGRYEMVHPGLWEERRAGGRSLFYDQKAGVWAVASVYLSPPYILQCPSKAETPFSILYGEWSIMNKAGGRWPAQSISAHCTLDQNGRQFTPAPTPVKLRSWPTPVPTEHPDLELSKLEKVKFSYADEPTLSFTLSPTPGPTPAPTPRKRTEDDDGLGVTIAVQTPLPRRAAQPARQQEVPGAPGTGNAAEPNMTATLLRALSNKTLVIVLLVVLLAWTFSLLVWAFTPRAASRGGAGAECAPPAGGHPAHLDRYDMHQMATGGLAERQGGSVFDSYQDYPSI